MQKVKVAFDRQYRGFAEITNQEKLHARIVGVPPGGQCNAEDTVELEYNTKKANVCVKKKVKRVEDGQEKEVEVDVLEEQDTKERVGDPFVAKILARKYERRTYVEWKAKTEPKKLIEALGKKGWPFEQFTNSAIVAHPKGTTVDALAATVGVPLSEVRLELQEED